mgnify:CR=1 FL=1
MFKQYDKDGYNPFTTLISQIRPDKEEEPYVKELLEIFMTNSINFEKEDLPVDYVSPIFICI